MSKPARGKQELSPAHEANRTGESLSTVIEKVKSIGTETKAIQKGIKDTEKEMRSIADTMKQYLSKDKGKKVEQKTVLGKDSLSKMYNSVYKGTYQGIVDGLAKVNTDKKIAEDRKRAIETSKTILKAVTIGAVKTPIKIAEALINLFAFERSEIVNTFRDIRAGVGVGPGAKKEYENIIYRYILEDIRERRKLRKKGVKSEGQEMIRLLTEIRDGNEEYRKRDRRFFSWLFGRRDSIQIELLRQIEENTAESAQGIITLRRKLLQMVPHITAGISMTLGALSGSLATLPVIFGSAVGLAFRRFVGLFRGINAEDLYIQREQLKQLKLIEKNTKNTPDTGFFGFFKKYESEIEVLRDIRNAVSPKEKELTGLAKAWHVFTKVPISELFKKQKEYEQTDSERIYESSKQIINLLEENNDYQDDILQAIETNLLLNRMRASEEREIANVMKKGVTVIPFNFGKLTPYEVESLDTLHRIEDINAQMNDSINFNLCDCLTNVLSPTSSNSSDDIGEMKDIMEKTHQQAVESRIDDKEEKMDQQSIFLEMNKNLDGIYTAITELPKATKKGSSEESIIKKASKLSETISDITNIGDALKRDTVNISSKSLKQLCSCMSDDDFDFPSRRKKGRRRKSGRRGRRGSRIPDIPDIKKTAKKGTPKGILGKGMAKLGQATAFLTGGAGLGLLTTDILAIGSLGAGAMAGAAGAAGASGIGGYMIGSMLNDKINSFVESKTGNESLGGFLYDLTHGNKFPNQIKKQQAQQKQQDQEHKSKTLKVLGAIGSGIGTIASSVSGMKTGKLDVKIPKVDGKIVDTISGMATTGSIKGKEIIDKGIDRTVDFINTSDAIQSMKELETVKAIKESAKTMKVYINDIKNTGGVGGGTSMVAVPVKAQNNDPGNDVLVHSFGT